MNIEQQINSIRLSKEAIRQAIVNKKVDCPQNTPLAEYASKIDAISAGGGSGLDVMAACDKVVSTVEKGVSDICVVYLVYASGYPDMDTYNYVSLLGAPARLEFSDGTTTTETMHTLTSVLDEGGVKYYWVKQYVGSLDELTMDESVFAVSVQTFGKTMDIPAEFYPSSKCKYIRHFDFGNNTTADEMGAFIRQMISLETCTNVNLGDKATIGDIFAGAVLLRDLNIQTGTITEDVNIEAKRLTEESMTNIIEHLGKPTGWGSFNAFYLTEAQKRMLTEKGWNY